MVTIVGYSNNNLLIGRELGTILFYEKYFVLCNSFSYSANCISLKFKYDLKLEINCLGMTIV